MPFILSDKFIFSVSGKDKFKFLQGLITNDIYSLKDNNILYSLMLTPQGRYFTDIFFYYYREKIFLEVPLIRKDEIIKKFSIYKLRSEINIREEEYNVFWSKEEKENFLSDPRSGKMGFRSLLPSKTSNYQQTTDYESLRISCSLPEGDKDLFSGISFPLEYGLNNFNTFSFNKGCYIGQELTARTNYRGVIRKEIAQVISDRDLPSAGTDLIINGEKFGIYCSNVGKLGLALIKKDKISYLENEKFIDIGTNIISFKFKENS